MTDFEKTKVKQDIQSAFGKISRPINDKIFFRGKADESAWSRVRRLTQDRWQDMPADVLTSDLLAMSLRDMTPDGFEFFIPAFMMMALELEGTGNEHFFFDYVRQAFDTPLTNSDRGNKVTTYTTRMNHLTPDQLNAVILFFNYHDEKYGYANERSDIGRILEYLVKLRESKKKSPGNQSKMD